MPLEDPGHLRTKTILTLKVEFVSQVRNLHVSSFVFFLVSVVGSAVTLQSQNLLQLWKRHVWPQTVSFSQWYWYWTARSSLVEEQSHGRGIASCDEWVLLPLLVLSTGCGASSKEAPGRPKLTTSLQNVVCRHLRLTWTKQTAFVCWMKRINSWLTNSTFNFKYAWFVFVLKWPGS